MADKYPSGWDYSLHLGTRRGIPPFGTTTPTNGRKSRAARWARIEIIDLPGMLTLYDRFEQEAEEMSSVSWVWET